jgi:ElaA protein
MSALSDITWELLHFSQLSAGRLHKILKARAEVFVVEQTCPYCDPDDYDPKSYHLIACDNSKEIAAYLRLIPPGEKHDDVALGRVITTKNFRGTGLGSELVKQGIQHAQDLYPQKNIWISAQHQLEKFYSRFGFRTISDVYDEDGVPHIDMLLNVKNLSDLS